MHSLIEALGLYSHRVNEHVTLRDSVTLLRTLYPESDREKIPLLATIVAMAPEFGVKLPVNELKRHVGQSVIVEAATYLAGGLAKERAEPIGLVLKLIRKVSLTDHDHALLKVYGFKTPETLKAEKAVDAKWEKHLATLRLGDKIGVNYRDTGVILWLSKISVSVFPAEFWNVTADGQPEKLLLTPEEAREALSLITTHWMKELNKYHEQRDRALKGTYEDSFDFKV